LNIFEFSSKFESNLNFSERGKKCYNAKPMAERHGRLSPARRRPSSAFSGLLHLPAASQRRRVAFPPVAIAYKASSRRFLFQLRPPPSSAPPRCAAATEPSPIKLVAPKASSFPCAPVEPANVASDRRFHRRAVVFFGAGKTRRREHFTVARPLW
jgi:hypothetical protein